MTSSQQIGSYESDLCILHCALLPRQPSFSKSEEHTDIRRVGPRDIKNLGL